MTASGRPSPAMQWARAWRPSSGQMVFALLVLWIALGYLAHSRRNLTDLATVQSAAHIAAGSLGVSRGVVPPPSSIGYALALTAIAAVTPGTREGLLCWNKTEVPCSGADMPFVIGVQLMAALTCVWLMWRTARTLSGSGRIALLATVLACLSLRLGPFAGALRGDIVYLFFLCLFMAGLAEAATRGSQLNAVSAGAALGCAALFQPLAAVMAPVAGVCLALRTANRALQPSPRAGGWTLSIWLMAAMVMTLVALLWTSASYYSPSGVAQAQLSAGFGRRAAFIGLDRGPWLAGLTLPVPWLGDAVEAILPADLVRKFAVGAAPGSLALQGQQIHTQAAALARGQGLTPLALMLRETVIAQPVGYLLSLPVVIARGVLAGGGLIALFGLLHVAGMTRFARAAGRGRLHLAVFGPIAVLFAANVLLTGNEFWLNPLLPFVYAYAIAYVSGGT